MVNTVQEILRGYLSHSGQLPNKFVPVYANWTEMV